MFAWPLFNTSAVASRGCLVLAPKGRHNLAQGASPGYPLPISFQPQRGDTCLLCRLFGAQDIFGNAHPGLAPWAKLCRRFGANTTVDQIAGTTNPLLVTSHAR